MTILLSVIAFVFLCFQPDRNVEIKSVIKSVLDNRRKIADTHATVTYDLKRKGLPSKEDSAVITQWYSKEHWRADITRYEPEGEVDNNKAARKSMDAGKVLRTVFCDNCERPGSLVTGNDGALVVRVSSPTKPPHQAHGLRKGGIDFRLLGLTWLPYPNLLTVDEPGWPRLPTIFEDPEFSTFDLVENFPKNIYKLKTKHIRFGLEMQVWIDTDLSSDVVRMDGSGTDKQGSVHTFSLRSSGHRQILTDLWYPTEIHTIHASNGKPTLEEHFKIDFHSVNLPIDPIVFTIAGMNFPNGKSVILPGTDGKGYVIWNGKVVLESSLSKDQSQQLPVPPVTAPVPTNPEAVAQPFRWYYIAAAVLFSGIAVYFFRRMLNRG